jgi:hypothetical protein
MDDFVADDGAEFGVGLFLLPAVADTAVVEIRAVSDLALVFVRPLHEAEVGVCWFH